jgi:hypothetical protein
MTTWAEDSWAGEPRAENAPWTDRDIELPGRGRTSIREVHGPPGAPTLVLLHGLAATGGSTGLPLSAPCPNAFA